MHLSKHRVYMIRLMIVGAGGRMGKEVVRAASASGDFKIVSAIERRGHPEAGKDAGICAGVEAAGVLIGSDLDGGLALADAVIDFSHPDSTLALLEAMRTRPRPAVIGTTGLDGKVMEAARDTARKAPVLVSPNLSYGVAVLKRLALEALKHLGGFDVEIVEAHHRGKADAPSGTAAAILKVIRESAHGKNESEVVYGRSGKEARRKTGEIGVHAIRGGSVTGEHSVLFLGDGERIEIKHTAESRKIFALGAIGALRKLVGMPPGLLSMDDLFQSLV